MLGPSTGVSGSVDPSTGKMVSQLAGTTVLFDGVAAPLLYVFGNTGERYRSLRNGGLHANRYCKSGIRAFSPRARRFLAQAPHRGFSRSMRRATGQAAAANQDGTFNGPSSPAAKGSYVTVYFTGGGQTNPAGVTGSITGSTLKWLTQAASVSVGGVAATVAFDGAAPTFVDGVLQLNIQLSAARRQAMPCPWSSKSEAYPAPARQRWPCSRLALVKSFPGNENSQSPYFTPTCDWCNLAGECLGNNLSKRSHPRSNKEETPSSKRALTSSPVPVSARFHR